MPKLVRDSAKVLAQLVENNAGEVITKQNCKIQVPVRFSTIGLGQIGINTHTYGLFALILDTGEYTVCNINSLIELNPSRLTIVDVNGVDYHQFEFEAYQVVIKTTTLVKRDSIMYNIFDEFIFKGKIPWYVDYEDLGKIFDSAKEYANSNVGSNQDVIEFIASLITRFKDDRSKPLRGRVTSYKEITNENVTYVPLNSVFYSVTSTLNKLAGSYFNDGVVSALVNKSTEVSQLESILRS